ncbi:MAG: hypothetical protein ACI8V5_000014 [Limisphaerales bacterium]|jgi:hypothetical protein|tara:strand:- start:50 stop:253 length:204 start_codon:yes stop_codon:yes gene_type:complete
MKTPSRRQLIRKSTAAAVAPSINALGAYVCDPDTQRQDKAAAAKVESRNGGHWVKPRGIQPGVQQVS